jgi:hypothetical protein
VYFAGVAKLGKKLGMHFNPNMGPTIPLDAAWHHIHIELTNNGGPDASGDAGAFTQKVMIDTTVVENTTADLSSFYEAAIDFGVLSTNTGVGQPDAVVYFDNVLLRAKP